jgi:TfoX/Sxy family transcriptional regulator of competence genes
MASSVSYRDFVMEQLAGLEGVSCRAMMGEYLLYVRGKVVGGVYDDRLLIKPTPAAVRMMPGAIRESPYEGAKEMLLVDRMEDPAFLCRLFDAAANDLPAPRKKD